MDELKSDQLRVRFKPRQINLEPLDASKISYLADGEVIEDPLGRHKPGTTFVINHGDLGSLKFPKIMFPAPNPIEFYLYSALKNLESIQKLEQTVAKDYSQVNSLLVEEFQFCIFSIAALEAFINQTIPGTYEFKDQKGSVSKAKIESEWSIQDKLKIIIPKVSGISVAGDYKIWTILTSLIGLRNDLIHLKTAYPVVSDFRSYQDLYRRLLDNDYAESFKVVQKVIGMIAAADSKIQAEEKGKVHSENRHSSWSEILRRGLRSLTG
jgi:hypothetical protein